MYSLALANFTEANDIDNAEKLLDKAINLKEDFMYYNNRGRIHYAKGNYTLALDDFDKSILLDSANSAAYNNRGAVRQQFCDFIGALSDYKKAVELNPDYQDALNNIKRVENLLSIDSVLFEKSENKAISEVDILNFVLYISEKMLNTGQKPKAILYLEQAIKVIPNNYEIYERLALIYHLNEEFSEAKDVYNQALDKLGKNESLLLGRGLLNIQIGDTVSACKDFKQSAELGNDRAKMLEQEFCGDTLSVKRVLSF
jgi:tetratricopeptide (TPR) repeat protein